MDVQFRESLFGGQGPMLFMTVVAVADPSKDGWMDGFWIILF